MPCWVGGMGVSREGRGLTVESSKLGGWGARASAPSSATRRTATKRIKKNTGVVLWG